MKRTTGTHRISVSGGETVRAFVPLPLPPDPPLDVVALQPLLERANTAVGRLDGVASILPDTSLFLYLYVRKEALLSSQIEGTQSSLSDLLLFEADEVPGVPIDDVSEVSNYVAAMDHGLRRLAEGFPLSLRLIREIHAILLRNGRGEGKAPGEFRTSQNWIGGTRPGNAAFVPPPPQDVLPVMGDLELFLHAEDGLPTLIRAGLAHVQFETVHPFLDGNGRLGRLLVTFLLCEKKMLGVPLLYLSLYLKAHRGVYYDLLQSVRIDGDWEAWLRFFLEGVAETADNAVATARAVLRLFEVDRERIQALGRPASSALRVHAVLTKRPLVTVKAAAAQLGLSIPTISQSLEHLATLGIVGEATGRRRNRVFVYTDYLALLAAGTEPLGPRPGHAGRAATTM